MIVFKKANELLRAWGDGDWDGASYSLEYHNSHPINSVEEIRLSACTRCLSSKQTCTPVSVMVMEEN